MTGANRRIGLEQEFFLVDETGAISHRADEFLQRCHAVAATRGCNPDYFAPEWVKSMVEINTPPAYSVTELAKEYLRNLQLAVTQGVRSVQVKDYLDSILEFVIQDGGEGSHYLAKFRSSLGEYQTTEADILQEFPTTTGEISREEGLQLVLQSCDNVRTASFVSLQRVSSRSTRSEN